MTLKLVYCGESGKVLGAQAVGGDGVDKRIDVVATALAFGLALTTLLVLILVPVMYSFFGESAREEHEEEYIAGHGPSAGGTQSSVAPDDADKEWLPQHLRETAAASGPESANA